MLGFTVPLFILLGFESVLALLLIGPISLARPVILFAKGSRTPVGSTIVGTLTAFLCISLASPLYDFSRLRRWPDVEKLGSFGPNRGEAEANAYLSLILTLASVLLLFVNRKLALTLSESEQLKVSQGAMLKQVSGLQAEYSRLSDESKGLRRGAGPGPGFEVQRLKDMLSKVEQEKEAAVDKLVSAEKARRKAENNADALATQAKGLENEYDRLLASHDELQRRLSRLDPGAGGADGGRQTKDD